MLFVEVIINPVIALQVIRQEALIIMRLAVSSLLTEEGCDFRSGLSGLDAISIRVKEGALPVAWPANNQTANTYLRQVTAHCEVP